MCCTECIWIVWQRKEFFWAKPAAVTTEGGDGMDLTEIMQEAQQSLGGDYEQLAVSNVQC